MTIGMISWSTSEKVMWSSWDSNRRPLALHSDGLPNVLRWPALPFTYKFSLTCIFTTLWANSADGKLMIFPIFYQKIGFEIYMKCHTMFYGKIIMKYFKMSSAEFFPKHAKHSSAYFIPCWKSESLLVLQMSRSAHWTTTIDTKNAVWHVYSSFFLW